MKSSLPFLCLAALFATSAVAQANISTSLVPVTIAGEPANLKTYDLKVTTDQDWTNSELHLSLTAGSVFQQTTFGNNQQPNPAFFGIVPDLQWDTFFTTPGGWPNGASQGTLPSFAGDTETATSLDTFWFDNVANGPGTYTVARITLSSDAAGSFNGLAFDTQSGGVGTSFSGAVGAPAPEPASLALLALGGMGLLARRKRA